MLIIKETLGLRTVARALVVRDPRRIERAVRCCRRHQDDLRLLARTRLRFRYGSAEHPPPRSEESAP
jgi:hypothetical protein